MSTPYFDTIRMIERLHRYFLDVVKIELDHNNIEGVNSVQAMLMFNIGHEEMTIGDLTLRGYYEGSNVSYNVKKLTESGYIEQNRSIHDKRSIRVSLTEKGKALYKVLDTMFRRHEGNQEGTNLTQESFRDAIQTLQNIERFWTAQTQASAIQASED